MYLVYIRFIYYGFQSIKQKIKHICSNVDFLLYLKLFPSLTPCFCFKPSLAIAQTNPNRYRIILNTGKVTHISTYANESHYFFLSFFVVMTDAYRTTVKSMVRRQKRNKRYDNNFFSFSFHLFLPLFQMCTLNICC